jgi:hypothetical protein
MGGQRFFDRRREGFGWGIRARLSRRRGRILLG